MLRLFFFLLGFGLATIGFVYIITYLNYLSIGYTFFQYINLVFTRFECLMAVIGIVIISLTILTKGDKNDIRVWFNS